MFMGTVTPWALQEMISRSAGKSSESTEEITEWLKYLVDQTAVSLRNTGLNVETHIRESDPRTALVQEAEHWSADCIFVGARGLGRFERFLLGSVSTAVTTRVACSVEIVRTT